MPLDDHDDIAQHGPLGSCEVSWTIAYEARRGQLPRFRQQQAKRRLAKAAPIPYNRRVIKLRLMPEDVLQKTLVHKINQRRHVTGYPQVQCVFDATEIYVHPQPGDLYYLDPASSGEWRCAAM